MRTELETEHGESPIDPGAPPARERLTSEIVLAAAKKYLSGKDYELLLCDILDGRVDMRVYDDGIVLMRETKQSS